MKVIDILTIMISYGRPELLERTIHSYFRTISVPFEFIVVDNGSNEETIALLKKLSKVYKFKVVFLGKNMGGLAYNEILNNINLDKYKFVHFSENDLEYHQNWDRELLSKLNLFKNVGQLSPYSPFPEIDKGEIWGAKQATPLRKGDFTIYLTDQNVGSTCIVRKELIQKGLRWKNRGTRTHFHFPADAAFSHDIRKLGYKVAWNDKYLATNWGHNILEIQKEIEYYVTNYKTKLAFDGFKKRLRSFGYKLVELEDGQFKLMKIDTNI